MNPEKKRRCSTCKKSLLLDSFKGHRKTCIKCLEHATLYRNNNIEKVNVCQALWRKNNPEKVKSNNAKWIVKDPAKLKAYSAKYRENNREKINERYALWFKNNRENALMRFRKYSQNSTNGYCKILLRSEYGVTNNQITDEIVAKKRDHLLLKREVNLIKKTIKDLT